jgi:hypothetical protein
MKIYRIAAAELKFNLWKFGFYYRLCSKAEWTRIPKCFTLKTAKKFVAKCQISEYLKK